MYSSVLSLPARRSAAAIGASFALTASALVLAPAAQATTAGDGGSGSGRSTAAVLSTGLDVSLLNKAVDMPLNVTLNDVHAPANANETALTAHLDGVDGGKPFNVLSADVATARATAETRRAEGYVNLVHARVHLPGLPDTPLIQVQQVTSKATCDAGQKPSASSDLLGDVEVLGKRVTLTVGGTTKVDAPGVGEVRLDLSKTQTTSSTSAATALNLQVSVNPAQLNVAQVTGDVTLAHATCQTPQGDGNTGGSSDGGATKGATGGTPSGGKTGGASQGGGNATDGTGARTDAAAAKRNLAETGADSSTPYLAAGAVALVAGGGAVLYVSRRRRAARGQG
ncbi:SCO1860 family LAETG-anchored protein [Streptantibioticus ferralitis]|uniref:SCO1860 family LAETG-anchored protein n=1 Tax=Streptantibioticus ferralitis TaxID=236510 RepID=A0ABT5YZ91_9ACTN|nr:SCO1860 family LAETG-anchored protein [Streptantibioticus ferralitis]MDF2256912.1 SCO1860 family LAETG-anchored protein [Streptantibioticus ferralitis]